MIKKLLVVVLVILLLFGVCATLEKEISPDGTATETEAMWQMAVNSFTESLSQIKDGIVSIFKSVTSDEKESSETSTEIGEISAHELPKEAQEYYRRYADENWETSTDDLDGTTKAGRKYKNKTKVLPEKTESGEDINYKEYDAETSQNNTERGTKRFVHGSDGSTYYTEDHYKTFYKIIE